MQDAPSNVILLISNQSFDINPVDIKISIDSNVIVHDQFEVQGDQPAQHNWRQYQLRLENGSHNLVVESTKGPVLESTTFEVDGQTTLTIAYWYGRRLAKGKLEGYFTIESGSRQVGTM